MKILEKFSGFYHESVFDRNKRNLQVSISKNVNSSEEKASSNGLNEATVYLSRQKSDTKINGIEEAYKLLNEMTRYLNSATQEVNAVELTQNMQFNPKKIASILIS
jgi:hypothetical protein